MISASGEELRAMAAAIEKTAKESPSYYTVSRIVQNCCDHIAAVARIHDVNKTESGCGCGDSHFCNH